MKVILASYVAFYFLLCAVVLGSGVMEVTLYSLHSAEGRTITGRCCTPPRPGLPPLPCPPPGCRPYARTCLRHFQVDPLLRSSACTFNSDVTPLLGAWHVGVGRDLLDAPYTIRLPFDFPWPKSFSLDIEIWHDSGNRNQSDPGDLIARTSVSDHLTPSATWTNQSAFEVTWQLRFGYRVICDVHYYGKACETLCRSRDDALSHFRCDKNGTRVCIAGWEGENCNKVRCSEACLQNGGTCLTPNKCTCRAGWRGADCEECQPRSGCLHGFCLLPGQCRCQPGWLGSLCNIDLDYCARHQPCHHGGTCFPDDVSNFTCACRTGWGGFDCRQVACYTGYCLHRGVCLEDPAVGRTCRCRRGYQGNRCQHVLTKCGNSTCFNSGTCLRDVNGSRCLCLPGYSGVSCKIPDRACASSPCLNGGTCEDRENGFLCHCPSGLSGRLCQLAHDPCRHFRCLHGGRCLRVDGGARALCRCGVAYTGSHCQTPLGACAALLCLNGGLCRSRLAGTFHCACPQGFWGPLCQFSHEADTCSRNPCQHGGTCWPYASGFRCSCRNGYHGDLCQMSTVVPENVRVYENSCAESRAHWTFLVVMTATTVWLCYAS